MNAATAKLYTGGLSSTGKMPCPSYSLSAHECGTGAKLSKVKGSVCEGCYAKKGNYRFPSVKKALSNRLNSLYGPAWVPSMVSLIRNHTLFRWHDSGDLQSLDNLLRIVEVVKATPKTRHWLPTKERGIIKQYLRFFKFPPNLVVRISSAMVDQKPQPLAAGVYTSTVHMVSKPSGKVCPASAQGGACDDCRACWDKRVKNVSYPKH